MKYVIRKEVEADNIEQALKREKTAPIREITTIEADPAGVGFKDHE